MSKATVSQPASPIQPIDYREDPHLDMAIKAFLKANDTGGPPIESLPKGEARNVLIDAQAAVKVDLSGIEVSERTITHNGYTIRLNIVRPQGVEGFLPVFVFVHGGGWVLGDFPTHQRMVRDLVVLSGYASVFVNYTPSPEAQFPQPTNEIYAATDWVSRHGHEIGVDGSRLAIVGNSAGGNMATVTALMATEKGGPKIRLQILMWPAVDANFETESFHLYGQQRFLTAPLMKWSYDQYEPDPEKRNDIHISPLLATPDQLKSLPPTLIQVAENDILRDSGEAYGRKLDAAGVPVTCIRYNGMIHDFGLLNELAELPTVRSLFIHAAAELKKHLG